MQGQRGVSPRREAAKESVQSAESTHSRKKVEDDGVVSAPLLSVAEAAKYLGTGRKIVYQLIEWGEIRAVKAGKSVLIEKDSLDLFRSSGKIT